MVIEPLVTSRFRLDGGSMFGVVPRVLWEKKAPPDGKNRIALNVNSLLVRTGGKNVLVETGMGAKYGAGQADIYALASLDVEDALHERGLSPQDIDVVILTHLHLDHAGGSTVLDSSGKPVPAFPAARYVVQERELRFAMDPHPLSRASYLHDDFRPFRATGQLEVADGESEAAPGIWVEPSPGHTPGHQVVRLLSGGAEALYLGDLVPTVSHLKLNWIMSWDIEPEKVYNEKARLLADAFRRDVLLFWSHDPEVAAARITPSAADAYGLVAGSIVPAGEGG